MVGANGLTLKLLVYVGGTAEDFGNALLWIAAASYTSLVNRFHRWERQVSCN